MSSKSRQNYHEESEALVNRQINVELNAYYQYLALGAFYGRDDVALSGFSKFFKKTAEEENEHAQKLIQYQNLRGGRVVLNEVGPPAEQEWPSPLAAIEFALCHYLEGEFLKDQVESINELAKHHTNLVRLGDGVGVFLYDKELHS